MSVDEQWSTVHVAMTRVGPEPHELSEATDRLEGVAAMLATRDDVGGVETRDPTCIADGPEFVAVERPELVVYTTPSARDEVERATRQLVAELGLEVSIDSADHQGDDWRDAWKRHYRPQVFGPSRAGLRLLIRPSWIPRQADDPALELVLDPGRAFGTGLHESTRLCLRALVELASEITPTRVLDLGCGSGILGLAAARLWPSFDSLVLADHDIEAVETARENAELNALGSALAFTQLDLGRGPLPRELLGAQLVIANIRPSVLIPAAPAIIDASTDIVILSGILNEEADEVRAAYATLRERERLHEADWCALVLQRS